MEISEPTVNIREGELPLHKTSYLLVVDTQTPQRIDQEEGLKMEPVENNH